MSKILLFVWLCISLIRTYALTLFRTKGTWSESETFHRCANATRWVIPIQHLKNTKECLCIVLWLKGVFHLPPDRFNNLARLWTARLDQTVWVDYKVCHDTLPGLIRLSPIWPMSKLFLPASDASYDTSRSLIIQIIAFVLGDASARSPQKLCTNNIYEIMSRMNVS